MGVAEITHINWASIVEKNAGFAIAFAILLIGGFLAFAIIKIAAKQITTLQDLIGNHMVSNIKAMKELTLTIREQRNEATDRNSKIMMRHEKAFEELCKIKGKLGVQ